MEADSYRLNHDSPLTERNAKTEINLDEYIVLKNTSGKNLALGDVQVGQGGNWWQFSATDTIEPNAYALVCYGTSADQTQFLSANNLPTALTTDPTIQWHWQSTIDFPDAEGQATVRLFENGKPGATLDQVYWNPDGLQAINAHCDATCQADPNREAVVSLQLDDYTYDPINPWDESKWTTAEATAKGKGSSQPEAPSAVRGLLKKEYELKDHLGNVHVVVTDRKHSDVTSGTPTDFMGDVVVMRDYYPFGMEMEGQGYVGGDYRYGFNGMERDDEKKGSGMSNITYHREFDPRIARWTSVDPRKSNSVSPFVAFGNCPTLFTDFRGDTIKIVGSGDFLTNTQTFLMKISITEKGKEVVQALESYSGNIIIDEAWSMYGAKYNSGNHTVTYDDNPWLPKADNGDISGLLSLAHELKHAYDHIMGITRPLKNGDLDPGQALAAEKRGVAFQNYIGSVYGFSNMRTAYSGVDVFPKNSTERSFNPSLESISIQSVRFSWNFDPALYELSSAKSDYFTKPIRVHGKGGHYDISYLKKTNTIFGEAQTQQLESRVPDYLSKPSAR